MPKPKPCPTGIPKNVWRRRKSITNAALKILLNAGPHAAEQYLTAEIQEPEQ